MDGGGVAGGELECLGRCLSGGGRGGRGGRDRGVSEPEMRGENLVAVAKSAVTGSAMARRAQSCK